MSALIAVLLCLQSQESQESTEDVKEVVVTATRSESDVLDVPTAVTVITREEIRESGATSLVEALAASPGFVPQGPNRDGHDALADLRGYNNGGGNGQRTLVLVDGRRTNGVASSATDWASIPIDNIERIEIVRGPAAVIYGDPALAGVINIVTRTGEKDKTAWRVGLSGGSFDSLRGAATVAGGWEGLTYSLVGAEELTDGWRENSGFEATNFAGNFEYALTDRWTLRLRIGTHDDDRRRPGTLTRDDIAIVGRRGTVTPNDRGDRFEEYADAEAQYSSETLGTLTAALTHLRGRESSFFASGFGDFTSRDRFDQSALYLKDVIDLKLGGLTWKLTTGIDLSFERAGAVSGTTAFTHSDFARRLVGAYTHVEVRPIAPLVLSGAARYDHAIFNLDRDVPSGGFGDSVDETRRLGRISPAIGAVWHVREEVSLYASWGRPFKYPTRDELVGFLVADPQLIPERASSFEMGARLWSGRWGQASAGTYFMNVKHEIFFDPVTFSNTNFDRVRHQGVEAEMRLTPVPKEWGFRVEPFAGYAYTRAIIESGDLDGKRYPVTPFHMGRFGATGRYEPVAVTLSGRLTGRRFMIGDVDNTEPMLPPSLVWDARADARWGKVDLFASVYNLFNREYYESGGLGFFGPAFNPAPERNFLVGMEASF